MNYKTGEKIILNSSLHDVYDCRAVVIETWDDGTVRIVKPEKPFPHGRYKASGTHHLETGDTYERYKESFFDKELFEL